MNLLSKVGFYGISAALGLLALLATGTALRAQSISMSYVTVGNPGNAPDPTRDQDSTSGYGSVAYTYDIGEYDVTDSQYCTFLNDVDSTGSNTLALYSPQGDAEYGITFNSGVANGSKYSVISGYASMPVVDVTYWSALRFVNWMNNGEGNASTENGAYTLQGDSPTPSNSASLLANPQQNRGATVWLPSENEWYKAAYYDPNLNGTGGYYPYATQSHMTPGNDYLTPSVANEANYYTGVYSVTQNSSDNSSQNYLTPVGSFTNSMSYYGTYDQSGDVWNWTSTVVSSLYPVLRGGEWSGNGTPYDQSSFFRDHYDSPTVEFDSFGFRVASVPEPNSIMLMVAGVAGLGLMRGRPRRRGRAP